MQSQYLCRTFACLPNCIIIHYICVLSPSYTKITKRICGIIHHCGLGLDSHFQTLMSWLWLPKTSYTSHSKPREASVSASVQLDMSWHSVVLMIVTLSLFIHLQDLAFGMWYAPITYLCCCGHRPFWPLCIASVLSVKISTMIRLIPSHHLPNSISCVLALGQGLFDGPFHSSTQTACVVIEASFCYSAALPI